MVQMEKKSGCQSNGSEKSQLRRKRRRGRRGLRRERRLWMCRKRIEMTLVLTVLFANLDVTTGMTVNDQKYWAFIPSPPWLKALSWTDPMPQFLLHGNLSLMFPGSGQPVSKQEISSYEGFNFTGLVYGLPFCVHKGVEGNWSNNGWHYTYAENSSSPNWCPDMRNKLMVLGDKGNPRRFHLYNWVLDPDDPDQGWTTVSIALPYPFCNLNVKRNLTKLARFPGFLPYTPCHTHQCAKTTVSYYNHSETLTSCHNTSEYIPDQESPGYPLPTYIHNPSSITVEGLERVIAAIGGISVQGMPEVMGVSNVTNNITLSGTVCVGNGFLFMVDPDNSSSVQEHQTSTSVYNLTCVSCKLFTCLNGSLPLDSKVYIVTRPHYAFTVVKEGHWYPNKGEEILDTLKNQLSTLRRKQRCVSCVVLGITLLVEAILASSSLALFISNAQNSIVQAQSLHNLMKNVSLGFKHQAIIDKQLLSAIELQTATSLLLEKAYSLELQQKLRCDYRYTSFCLTRAVYNESQIGWNEIRAHLHGLNKNNITFEIARLIQIADYINKASYDDLTPNHVAENIIEGLEKLNPTTLFQSLIPTLALLLILCCLIPVFLKCFLSFLKITLERFKGDHFPLSPSTPPPFINKKGGIVRRSSGPRPHMRVI
ncbi:endogenous retrovirus group K member 6 Env polyprotein-like [Macrotis lagotis]|uniref:endogenous retrovirus group K member 6 Env polyprotein-like n=1 Tax=Macrotis lagotis TaxID=92651 RepID=UPI003D688604